MKYTPTNRQLQENLDSALSTIAKLKKENISLYEFTRTLQNHIEELRSSDEIRKSFIENQKKHIETQKDLIEELRSSDEIRKTLIENQQKIIEGQDKMLDECTCDLDASSRLNETQD